jgi:hypothetical protein
MVFAFEKEKYQSIYKIDVQFLHRCLTRNFEFRIHMNLENISVNVIQKALINCHSTIKRLSELFLWKPLLNIHKPRFRYRGQNLCYL